MPESTSAEQLEKRPTAGKRLLVVTGVLWALLTGALSVGRGADAVQNVFTLPLSFFLREMVGRAPQLDPRLKIFSLDDRTYAALRRPHLTGVDWADLLHSLASADPAVIITTHMFGTGEFDDPALESAVRAIKARGIKIVAAAFAYPGDIPHRDPLALGRPEFRAAHPVVAARHLSSRLYGPDRGGARLLSAIGHVGYDGKARTAPYLDFGGQAYVPHLALAAAANIAPTLDARAPGPARAIDGRGRVIVDLSPFKAFATRSKTLKTLLPYKGQGRGKRPTEAKVARFVSPGDTVLILTDMYTGKANFVETPRGPLPGGYVAAAMINSVLRQRWLELASTAGWSMTILLGLAGLLVGRLASSGAFLVTASVMTIGVPIVGLTAFIYGSTLIAWPVALVAFLGPAGSIFAWRLRLSNVASRLEQERLGREAAKLTGVVRTSQMFAHDVRKPFSILKIALRAARRQPGPEAAARYLQGVVPDIERAMAHVEDMIRDVLEIEGEAQVKHEPTAVEDLISEALRQVFAVSESVDAKISYRFEQTLEIAVDRSKVRRALVNVIDNAVDAMGGAGRLWITARDLVEVGLGFVEITIGNSGSFVAPEVRDRLFEAFYTQGKGGGTGLGLALVRKVVTMHGGRIHCESTADVGTEFVMTFPVAHVTPRPRSARLPASGSDYRASLVARPTVRIPAEEPLVASDDGMSAAAATLAQLITPFRDVHGRVPRALVVDGDSTYREDTRLKLADLGFDVATAHDSQGALQAVAMVDTELVLIELDLGRDSPGGADVAAALRALGCSAHIALHSLEHPISLSEPRGIGRADQFIAKPLSPAALVHAACQALRRATQQGESTPLQRPTIAVLDDSVFVLEAWELIAADAEVHGFISPAAFWVRMQQEPTLLDRLDAVITDLHFGELAEDGLSFAADLKRRLRVPIFLSTNGTLVEALGPDVDAKIEKEPVPFAELKRVLKR